MIVTTDLADIPADAPPSAVTIGKFDGVHLGHRAVIERLRVVAGQRGLRSVVVTFDRHPLALFAPDKAPARLVGPQQKLELLRATGIDATVMLAFDEALSKLSAERFVVDILVGALNAKAVLVGADFRFGHRGAGTVETLERLGREHDFTVEVVTDVFPDESRRASSTWIRELLSEGRIPEASAVLGHLPSVRGVVVHGAKRGRELGFPTANLSPDAEGFVPADGIYAGWLRTPDRVYPAAISVGNNPTFDGVPQRQVEAYVLDHTDLDLYGVLVDVSFVDRIRGMVAFTGIDPLIAQMTEDVTRVRELLANATPGGRPLDS